MRRFLLEVLRCPKCRRGELRSETNMGELLFGPLSCASCQTLYPLSEGIADLVLARASVNSRQRLSERPSVARWYERLRPLGAWRRQLGVEKEFLLYRSLLGDVAGPVLNVDCGTGLFARRLAQALATVPILGTDVSKAMLEEALALSREAGTKVDFIRAQGSELPLVDGSLGAVLQLGGTHFQEVARILRPGGRYVATLPTRISSPQTDEALLRQQLQSAGFTGFQTVRFSRWFAFKADRQGQGK